MLISCGGQTPDNGDNGENGFVPDEELSGNIVYQTGFEDAAAKNSYALGTMDDGDIEWELDQVLKGNLDGDLKTGSYALRGRYPGHALINESFTGIQGIAFDAAHANFAGTGSGNLVVQISVDKETWIGVLALSPQNQLSRHEVILDYNLFDFDVDARLYVRFLFGGGEDANGDNTTRINIDNVEIHGFED